MVLTAAVPYAKNPAPSNLTMPYLNHNQGRFGAGKSASNGYFYITVLELWGSCEVSLVHGVFSIRTDGVD